MEMDVRHMKGALLTLLRHTSEKGQHRSKGVLSKFKLGLNFIDWTSTPSSSLQNYELELLITTELVMLELKPTTSLVINT